MTKALKLDPEHNPVVKALREKGPMTTKELCKVTGGTKDVIYKYTSMMKKKGVIESTKSNPRTYRLTEQYKKGHPFLSKPIDQLSESEHSKPKAMVNHTNITYLDLGKAIEKVLFDQSQKILELRDKIRSNNNEMDRVIQQNVQLQQQLQQAQNRIVELNGELNSGKRRATSLADLQNLARG